MNKPPQTKLIGNIMNKPPQTKLIGNIMNKPPQTKLIGNIMNKPQTKLIGNIMNKPPQTKHSMLLLHLEYFLILLKINLLCTYSPIPLPLRFPGNFSSYSEV